MRREWKIFMAYLKLVRCRLAIQCCIGYFPDGRERHRTFSLQDIRPDASADALAAVVRAIAPLLAHPITKVSIVKKYVLVLDSADAWRTAEMFSDARDAESLGLGGEAGTDNGRADGSDTCPDIVGASIVRPPIHSPVTRQSMNHHYSHRAESEREQAGLSGCPATPRRTRYSCHPRDRRPSGFSRSPKRPRCPRPAHKRRYCGCRPQFYTSALCPPRRP